MILLIGVLALSWRLNNDPTTRPSVSQNTLTPGMGFVDDDSDPEAEANTLKTQADEEVDIANGNGSSFRSPRILSTNDSRTPTMNNNDLLSITRLRRKGITESEEIWEELEDDALAELSPFSRRRSSARSNPSLNLHSRENPKNENTNEPTAFLARSGTGRSYRDRRRRRSTPNMGTHERERSRRSASSQETSDSWWKVKSWWREKERKDKGKGTGNDTENGNGDSG